MAKKSSAQYLAEYTDALAAIDARAEHLLATIDHATFNRQPEPTRWSVAQCFVHLTKFNTLYIRVLEHTLRRTAGQRGSTDDQAPFAHNIFERFFLSSAEPPPRFKIRAPASVRVEPSQFDLQETQTQYFATHAQFRELLREAQGKNLKQIRVRSPLSRLVKLSWAAAAAVLLAHERRHLWQAEAVARAART